MIDRDSPVNEAELHAYVDGELSADRVDAVVAWLAAHPEQSATIAAWRAQAENIRAWYGGVINDPVPARLKLESIMRQVRPVRSLAAVAAAAAVAAFVVGGAAGWMARGASAAAPGDAGSITADALEAHKLYVVEVRHPVEVPGNERTHMTQWLSKRLGYQQHIPDLQAIGLKLIGGRLLPGPIGAAAMYMYEGPSGERFTLYCSKAKQPESALRYRIGQQFAAFTWIDEHKVGYVVTGAGDRERLERVTKAIYEQVDRSDAKKS
jgi:anti-sigma factor RsiW